MAENDTAFAKAEYFQKMCWLKNEKDDLYDPSYSDLLRIAFTSNFNRGQLSGLVGLLSGRNFETRTYEKHIEETSYQILSKGVQQFINETHFKLVTMIIRSAGFVDNNLIRPKNALNFAYILYLKLTRDLHNEPKIEAWVRRWFVLSILTGRYSGSPESSFDYDIRQVHEKKFEDFLGKVESAELGEAFWEAGLVPSLTTSSINSPVFTVFLAAQAYMADQGFLSKGITVRDMLTHHGDTHHVFPRNFL